ncbi:hypothetical protein VQ056_15105 [Paenibacillus sp. JTLBN-2024]
MPASSHEPGSVQKSGFWWSEIKNMSFIHMLLAVWLAGVLFFSAKTVFDQNRLKQALRAGRTIDTPFYRQSFKKRSIYLASSAM